MLQSSAWTRKLRSWHSRQRAKGAGAPFTMYQSQSVDDTEFDEQRFGKHGSSTCSSAASSAGTASLRIWLCWGQTHMCNYYVLLSWDRPVDAQPAPAGPGGIGPLGGSVPSASCCSSPR